MEGIEEHHLLLIMRSRVCFISIALLSVTAGKPLSSPGPDDAVDFSDMWASDGDFFSDPAANLDSSVLSVLDPVSSNSGYDYSMFSDSDADLSSAFALDSDGENTSNLVASCVGDSNVDPSSGFDILKSRDLLEDQTWTSLDPSTEQKICPGNPKPNPPPEPPLKIPSLFDFLTNKQECPPLPDGRKRQPLCCYDPDMVTPTGVTISKNCWRCQYIIIIFTFISEKSEATKKSSMIFFLHQEKKLRHLYLITLT